ncbi:MAG TPA: macrolide ABC transporter ATP-binding protein, partial [Syntrophobacteraceae bacterium]|nr:macrolide ABC transporter ATP-binding protein [Syntrophobacteraceae bacterium]
PTGNLDSHTSEEVLEIFQRLNQDEGVTIVLVTHDEEVARCAKRVIRIHDGAIVAEDVPAQVAGMQSDDRRLDDQSGKTRWFSGAALLRARRVLRTALNGLRRNVMRAALTT